MKRINLILVILAFLAFFSLPAAAHEGKPGIFKPMPQPAPQVPVLQLASLAPLQDYEMAVIDSEASLPVSPLITSSRDTMLGPASQVSTLQTVSFAPLQDAEPALKSAEPLPPPVSSVITPYMENAVASQAIERNISLFSTKIRERFALYLSRSGNYLDMMKDILRKKEIPEDIVFLSLIESGFNPHAYSVAHAAGPWQFIASTARRYGLEIDWWKDERRDPIKSTEAAADYLKDLYEMFGSWNLAMAAYNAGEGKILKAMKRSKADDYWSLIGTKHIRSETKEYVPRFIAASLIATNPQDFGFDDIEYGEPLSYDEVKISAPLDLAVAAECAGTTVDEIRRLNPELRRWCTPPDAPYYTLRIPEGTGEKFHEHLASIPEEERFTIERYTVKKGDTFKRIGRKTGIPVQVILSLNATEKVMPLKAGSTIYLPPKGLFNLDKVDKAMMKKASYRKGRAKKNRAKGAKAVSRSKKI